MKTRPERLPSVVKRPLPDDALLRFYLEDGAYTDCYTTDVEAQLTHAQFIEAFYTTALFRIERFILRWLVSKPSSDSDVRDLAAGRTDTFAAWFVEKRSENQVLLSDFRGRTRSWLMVGPASPAATSATRLYFGSAVVTAGKEGTAKPAPGFGYRALLGFHKLYSVALLRAATSRLMTRRDRD